MLMDKDCVLCGKYAQRIYETTYFFAILDDFPLRRGHTLLIPRWHIERLTDLSVEEFSDLSRILQVMVKRIKVDLGADDYNLGVNCGEAAGQTLSHLHIHLIPRYAGDVDDPRGGIRKFLPNPLTEYPEVNP
jgi:diadenosine tetraphosphate (Ap4A) HIT family hydrolase